MTDDLHKRDAVDPFHVKGPDGIIRPLDEHYDNMKDVEKDLYGAWLAIQNQSTEIAALLARLARAEAALDAVDQVLESRIDQWESDDDLSDWVKPAKIIQADVAAEILAQIEERGE